MNSHPASSLKKRGKNEQRLRRILDPVLAAVASAGLGVVAGTLAVRRCRHLADHCEDKYLLAFALVALGSFIPFYLRLRSRSTGS